MDDRHSLCYMKRLCAMQGRGRLRGWGMVQWRWYGKGGMIVVPAILDFSYSGGTFPLINSIACLLSRTPVIEADSDNDSDNDIHVCYSLS